MGAKRKFKRDYIILEAKDANFRYKERVLPKAFAKVEVNEEKSVIALYVENLKYMKDGYRVVAIRSDYETIDLGKIVLSEQGKGEFVLNLEDEDAEIKGIALLYEKTVPLIGFKGNKIENYEEILFTADDADDEYEEYEEVEYIEVDDDDDDEYEDYEEVEYIENEYEEYEEYDDDDDDDNNDGYEEYEEYQEYEEYEDYTDEEITNYDYIKPIMPKQRKTIGNHNQRQRQQQPSRQHAYQQPYKQQPSQQQYQPQDESAYKSTGAFLMPRQIKKGLKYFREVKPFVSDYIEDTRWWKIEITPTTLCGYTMPYLGYINTLNFTMYSDIIMNSYKYRHYLFGVQYDEYNKRKNYIYAIPGPKDEQPDKGFTGFTTYQPCDTRNNSLGYWLCFIDPRSRKIIK